MGLCWGSEPCQLSPSRSLSLSPLLPASVWSLIQRPAMGLGLGCVFPQLKCFQQLSGACDAAVRAQEVTPSREKSGLWLLSYPWRRVSRCSEGEAGPVPGFSQVCMVSGPAHLHCRGWGAADPCQVGGLLAVFRTGDTGGDTGNSQRGSDDSTFLSYLKVGVSDHTVSVGLVKASKALTGGGKSLESEPRCQASRPCPSACEL